MRVFVEGVGLVGPGLNGWHASRPVLAGDAAYAHRPTVVTASELLPAAERRRTGLPVMLALAAGRAAFVHAGRDAATTATVFTSSCGDGENLHHICATLASPEREISPTRFHNSVHNAPAGYWSIATRSHASSSSLCCHDASFAAGLLDGPRLQTLLGAGPRDTITLLLYHTPDLAPEAAAAGIDLQLSGHTHGGQVRLPLFGALYAASLYGKRYEVGRLSEGGLTLYVTRGVGLEGKGAPRVRFLCPPEIVLWELGGLDGA